MFLEVNITFPFFPTWYHLFSVLVPSTSFQRFSMECSIYFSNLMFIYFYLVLSYFLFISSDLVRDNWAIDMLNIDLLLQTFFCFCDCFQSIFESIFCKFTCSVMLNLFPSCLWSCNSKLLFSDFNNSICACNTFSSFLKDSSNFSLNVLSSSLSPLSISLLITIICVSIYIGTYRCFDMI